MRFTYIVYVDMCMKSEGKGLDAECEMDSDCHDCPAGKHKICEHQKCWCYDGPPPSNDIIPSIISQIEI